MAVTPVLGLPLMEAGQGGSNVLYNEAMNILDTATGGGGGTGVPGGANGQAQYKIDAVTFGGSSGLTLSATQVTALALASPLSLTQGGTQAATAAQARINLGLEIGVNVQAQDAELSALAAQTSAADRLFYFTGAGSGALTVFTSAARTLLDDPDTVTQRTTLGLGDLAVLDTVPTTSLDNSAVTYAKIQNVSSPPRVLGRYSAGAGSVQELTLGTGLTVDGAGVITAATGGGAPTDAEYVTSTASGTLSAERVLTDTATITWDRTTAGQIKANAIGGGGYTDEQAQDAVGAILLSTATIDLAYLDATPSISAIVKDASITEAKLTFVDVTTKDASASTHGLLRKLSGVATEYLNGAGAWTVPATGTSYTDEQAQDAVGAMLLDTATIDLVYTDATPTLSAAVVAGSIGTTQLMNDAVTYAKLQNVTDARLLGRSAGSAGDAQELTVGAGLSLSAGALTATGQPLDATLTALAALATGADQLPYATGTDTFAQTTLTTFARTLLDDTSQAAMRTTLGLTPGTDVQAQDAELQALAGLTSAADRLPYFTGLGTAALATFTAAGRTLAGAADAGAQRTALALGTMAQQDAGAVAITGGSVTGLSGFSTGSGTLALFGGEVGIGTPPVTGQALTTNILPVRFNGKVGIGASALGNSALNVEYSKETPNYGIVVRPTDNNTGAGTALLFLNQATAIVGSIDTTASGTVFNTLSDVRLKHAISALTGALDVIQALRPITHLWNADGSRGYGFLAHELQREIPDAVTGEPDAVNDDGSVKPQQVDHSKLVVWLTAALQETLAQVQALAERVAALEGAIL